MKIGVFDSGVGGLQVANTIKKSLPQHQIIFKNDAMHVPYGSKSVDEILAFCLPVLESLVQDGVACIVIACNTVSTNLIELLRQVLSVPLIAMEPMIKPAVAQTKSGCIAVCATPATLSSQRYQWLKQTYATDVTVIEPDCHDWSTLIEHNQMTEERIRHAIEPTLIAGADVIVLGCTHYHWIEEEIKQIVHDKAVVIQPEQAVIRQLKRVLAEL